MSSEINNAILVIYLKYYLLVIIYVYIMKHAS